MRKIFYVIIREQCHYGFISILTEQFLAKEIANGIVKPVRVPSGSLVRPAGLVYRTGSLDRKTVESVANVIRICSRDV